MADDPDETSLLVNGTALAGWTDVSVTRGLERCPSSFRLGLTDNFPGQAKAQQVQMGDKCQVLLGGHLVLTGYVDTVTTSIGPQAHGITVAGRGKCQDLVDCSAEWPGGQISGTSAFDIAQKLAQPYGISVTLLGPSGPAIPQFNLMLGETGYQIIERVSRAAALLVYEDERGDLVLDQVGNETHASGIAEGVNIQEARAERSIADRYSEYDGFQLSMDVLQDLGDGGNLMATATDGNVPRHRKLYVIADGGGQGLANLKPRVHWEMTRRWGRGYQIFATVDSWRDAAGKLWTPNAKLPADVPTLKETRDGWMITEVTYMRDEQGTRAELHLMPPEAFVPEPVILNPTYNDVVPPSK